MNSTIRPSPRPCRRPRFIALGILAQATEMEPGETWTYDPSDLRLPEQVQDLSGIVTGTSSREETLRAVAEIWDEVLLELARHRPDLPAFPGEGTILVLTDSPPSTEAVRRMAVVRVVVDERRTLSVETIERDCETVPARTFHPDGTVRVLLPEDFDRYLADRRLELADLDLAPPTPILEEAIPVVGRAWTVPVRELGLELLGSFVDRVRVVARGEALDRLDREVELLQDRWKGDRAIGTLDRRVPWRERIRGLEAIRNATRLARLEGAVVLLQ